VLVNFESWLTSDKQWQEKPKVYYVTNLLIESIECECIECDQSNYSSRIVFFHIPTEFGQTGISAIRSADHENRTVEPNMKWIGRPLAQIWPLEISPIWAKCRVGWSVGGSVGRSVINIYLFLH